LEINVGVTIENPGNLFQVPGGLHIEELVPGEGTASGQIEAGAQGAPSQAKNETLSFPTLRTVHEVGTLDRFVEIGERS